MGLLQIAVLIIGFVAIGKATIGRSRYQHRIVGGSEANKYTARHQVSLKRNGDHICGGSIIKKHWFVCAAHCTTVCYGECTAEYGKLDRYDGVTLHLEKIIDHPDWREGKNPFYRQNDISLVKVREPFVFGEFVKPIELNTRDVSDGVRGLITGWGQIRPGVYPLHLQVAPMQTVACPKHVQSWPFFMCLHSEKGSACYGDSGGPFVIDGKLAGVAAFPAARTSKLEMSFECGPGKLMAYTRVNKYIGWILNTIQNESYL